MDLVMEQEQVRLELESQIGNSFYVNQLTSTYPKPNGVLVQAGLTKSKFKSVDGAILTVDNYIASNIIWGR